MAYIPSEVWREIFVLLGVEELKRLRCVCSSLRNLIDCPMFCVHHGTLPSSFPDQNLILFTKNAYYILGVEKTSPNDEAFRARIVRFNGEVCQRRRVEQSYNGLVLGFDCLRGDGVFAWNPFSRRHQNLAPSDLVTQENVHDMYYGIGFDEIARDCKLVLIRQYYKNYCKPEVSTDVYVCQLRNPSCWKRMDLSPLPALRFDRWWPQTDAVFVSGALHWMVDDETDLQRGMTVLAIDLGTEEYRLMPLPVARRSVNLLAELCVLGGCLCITFVNRESRLEAWVMKEYGLFSSWSMLYDECAQELGGFSINKPSRPVAYLDCGRRVVISFSGCLIWYHLQKQRVEHTEPEGLQQHPETWFTSRPEKQRPETWFTSRPEKHSSSRSYRFAL